MCYFQKDKAETRIKNLAVDNENRVILVRFIEYEVYNTSNIRSMELDINKVIYVILYLELSKKRSE